MGTAVVPVTVAEGPRKGINVVGSKCAASTSKV